jgi:hypothetical protein
MSRDGQWIYFGSDKTGRLEVWKMPAVGGVTRAANEKWRARRIRVSRPQVVYYSKGVASPTTIWRAPPSGGDETQVVDGLSYSLNFVVADKGSTLSPPRRTGG